MNNIHLRVLHYIIENNKITQREISTLLGISLGKVNNIMNALVEHDYLDKHKNSSEKTREMLQQNKPASAIILAAGYGFRMVPINQHTNKALIEVKGEVLIERLIQQLRAVNINDITIVVGYMKEKFDYLIDKFDVKLKVNMDYNISNNLYSLNKVKHLIDNTYIIPCDLYFKNNPFSTYELYSWYMVSDQLNKKSVFQCSSGKIKYVKEYGNHPIGLAYISNKDKNSIVQRMEQFVSKKDSTMFWEEILIENKTCIIDYNLISHQQVEEFNTVEDLQKFDAMSPSLKTEILEIVEKALQVSRTSISNIVALKTGMTNRSFLFQCKDKKYIMRIPGEGTDRLINRYQEKDVYEAINSLNICDKVIYFDAKKGYKLTEFIEHTYNCNSLNEAEVKACMKFLKQFHSLKLRVKHQFDLFEKIEYYQKLWNGHTSIYRDYTQTKERVFSLKKFIDEQDKECILSHIDAVPDNFLLFEEDGEQKIRLIDWEYASMQDPHVDIAMFAVYAMYDRTQIDQLIHAYFEKECDSNVRIKIYCYIACCGLLWSNWCEYKQSLGVEFGEYALAQYRFAKDYYKIAMQELEKRENL